MTEARPDPVEQSVDAAADFHLEHYRSASSLQRGVDRVTLMLGRPAGVLAVIGVAALWFAFDLRMARGAEPTFTDLELAATLVALIVSVLILATQRREEQLAERRAQLMLELALLADKKNAKIIALLEELRRDAPNLASRVDEESEQMTAPTDPNEVLQKIDQRTQHSGVDPDVTPGRSD